MSRTKPTEAEAAQLFLACGYCTAGSNVWCTTRRGQHGWSDRLHADRQWLWMVGWRAGYWDGLRDTLSRAEVAEKRSQTLYQFITDLKRDLR